MKPFTSIEDHRLFTRETRRWKEQDNIIYPAMALAAEAGEVAGEVSRILRDDDGKLEDSRREKILDELGDVLYCVHALIDDLQSSVVEVQERNRVKLVRRKQNNTLQGSGDR